MFFFWMLSQIYCAFVVVVFAVEIAVTAVVVDVVVVVEGGLGGGIPWPVQYHTMMEEF